LNLNQLDLLFSLRHDLHRSPELSGEESETAKRIADFLAPYKPDLVLENIGGNGLAVVFSGKYPGPCIVFRAELDALPIQDLGSANYKSQRAEKAHACGHDGHMTIIAGVATALAKNKLERGKLVLLFQPAEETGEGARKVMQDKSFRSLNPSYIYGFHNVPGRPLGEVLLRESVFSMASVGVDTIWKGAASHAAEPEQGRSPWPAIVECAKRWTDLSMPSNENFSLVTLVHCSLGRANFGVSPGNGRLCATLRAAHQSDFNRIRDKMLSEAQKIAGKFQIQMRIKTVEEFPSTVNHPECVKRIESASQKLNMPCSWPKEPFRWSEDFGYFTREIPGAFFGLGSGERTPPLHDQTYDFPDSLINLGVNLLTEIVSSHRCPT
jgi:amidohydrolase